MAEEPSTKRSRVVAANSTSPLAYTGTPFDLRGRVALVTGGSKGLGLAIARGFAEAGADIIICSRHGDELEAARLQIADGLSVRTLALVADMADRASVRELARKALEKLGRVDILVNNAGVNTPEEIDAISDEKWDQVLEINLTSCMALSRELAPQMKERRWGRIIHISSIMGLISKGGRASYSATKSALLGLTRGSAIDLGDHGITVNAICPGLFLTDMPRKLLTKEQLDVFASRAAIGRTGEPKELVGPALMLASEAGSFITGSVLTVDGGLTIKGP